MSIHFSIPARVNILGNPSDGNEGDFATISAAIELRAHASIESHTCYILEQEGGDGLSIGFKPTELPLPYNGSGDLLKGALNRLLSYSHELHEKFPKRMFRLKVWSEVPRQSGLGGSSLFVLLVLAAMREYYELDRRIHNDYILSELTQHVEAEELGITCGFADRYVPLFGGLAYLDYRGKLFHAEIEQEPFVTYERLDGSTTNLTLVAITTGIPHDSGDVHACMRARYLKEHEGWQKKGGEMPPMVSYMYSAWECAWRGKIALLAGDMIPFGKLMDKNHQIVDEMMHYCGFSEGAGWANNLFINVARQNGALGAKLTGAGGGGSIFALVAPGKEENLMKTWRDTAQAHHLESARVFPIHISNSGLVVTYR